MSGFGSRVNNCYWYKFIAYFVLFIGFMGSINNIEYHQLLQGTCSIKKQQIQHAYQTPDETKVSVWYVFYTQLCVDIKTAAVLDGRHQRTHSVATD